MREEVQVTADEQAREGLERCCNVRHQFLVERINALTEATDDRFTAEEKAMLQRWSQLRLQMEKVEDNKVATDVRQNEWRQTVNDILGTRLSRSEYSSAHDLLTSKADDLARRVERIEGQGVGANRTVGYLFALVGGLAGIIGIIVALLSMFAK
jgi:hypothetical protein